MIALKLTRDGDLDFNGKELEMVEELDQLAQEVRMSWGTAKGEWFLDEEEGTDYAALKEKKYQPDIIRSDFIEGIGETSQEVTVEELNLPPNNQQKYRKFYISAKLRVIEDNQLVESEVEL